MYVDLLVGLISVSTDLVWHITVQWYAGNVACKLVRYLQVCIVRHNDCWNISHRQNEGVFAVTDYPICGL